MRKLWIQVTAMFLVLLMAITGYTAYLNFDLNGNGMTDIADLQQVGDMDKEAALVEALGGGDELHKNAEGKWEIWSSLGLYNMANHAQSGDTFVLMQDIDMDGASWTPIENFRGHFIGNENYTISNVKITSSIGGNMGFFGSVAEGATVYRLNLKDVNLIADDKTTNIGILAGSCAGTVDACTTVGFVSDSRTALNQDIFIGGLVGNLSDSGVILTDVENMLYASPTDDIPNISSQLATNLAPLSSDQYARTVAIVGKRNNGSVDNMALLQDMSDSMADPNAIAWVKNGDVTTYPHTQEELLGMIRADGNSIVTLQCNLYVDYSLEVPYTSTWDLNGFTIDGNPTVGYGLNIAATGYENPITTVKNGTINTFSLCVRAQKGGVVVKNMKLHSKGSACVGIYDSSADYNDTNAIVDSELYSAKWGVFSYNNTNTDFSNVSIEIARSKLVSYKSGGSYLFVKQTSSTSGTVVLGYDVELYTYSSELIGAVGIDGVIPAEMPAADVNVNGQTYKAMNYWTTSEELASTEPMAVVTNGDTIIEVTGVKALTNAVVATGNTKVKLLRDITISTPLSMPYSCELDLNGYSITSIVGDTVCFLAKGSENKVAKVTNGTINHVSYGVRVDDGSVNISDVTINGQPGCDASVAFCSTSSAYRSGNKIENCEFYNPAAACVTFPTENGRFQNTGVTIENSTLIASNSYVFDKGTSAYSGVITLGDKVVLYGNETYIAPADYRYAGKLAGLTEKATVNVGDTELTLNCWDTEKQTQTVNVLLVGNSLSMTIPKELYNIAKNDGIELFVGDLYHAGCRGWEHWEWYNNWSKEYQFRVHNDMGAWIHGDIKTSNEAIDYLQWQHVSYQEYITKTYAATKEDALANHELYVDNMIGMLKTECPDAKHYYYQHWSFQIGHSTIPNVATQEAQANILKEVSEYLSEKNNVILIPCGQAWELARDHEKIGDTLCKADKLHASPESGGLYLNGCVFYETMFQKSCIGDTWRVSGGPSEEIHQIMQQIAHQTVATVHGENYAK